MRVLVAYGTHMGGTAGIAKMLAKTLTAEGLTADACQAHQVTDVLRYDAAIIGGAVYANRWHPDARRLVARHLDVLTRIPVWLFSSGPLDGSAATGQVPAVPEVTDLLDRVQARGHVTFGGCLPTDLGPHVGSLLGPPPSAEGRGPPADGHASPGADWAGPAATDWRDPAATDWRDPPRIRAWAREVAAVLRDADRVAG